MDHNPAKSVSIVLAAALAAGANLAIWFPGDSGPDAESQYLQAVTGQFDDWHPPIMARLWSAFRLLADGDGPMFCFQVVCYWAGLGLIAVTLARTGRWFAAWAMLGVGLFPSLLTTNIVLVGDVGMGATLLGAFAALFWCRAQNREIPPAIAVIALVLLLYGALVRANAIFAVVPLFAYMMRPQWLERPWRLLAISIPVALAIFPAANLFNHRVLQAERLGAIRSLQIFDITGVAFHSGDVAVFGPDQSFTRDDGVDCYRSAGWDRLAPWGVCRFFWDRLAVAPDLRRTAETLDARGAMGLEPNPDLSSLWIAAILRHPLAYAQHRLAHFISEITRGASMGTLDATAPRSFSVALYDAVTASALWIAIGACALLRLVAVRSVRRTAPLDASLALLLSGLSYAGAYLAVGVATELRYFFWSILAIFTAVVISLPELSAGRAAAAARSGRSRKMTRAPLPARPRPSHSGATARATGCAAARARSGRRWT